MALWLHSKWGTTPINTKNYRAIRDRKISAFQWNQVGNPPEGLIGDSAETLIDEADPRASDWLYGSDKWNKSFPEGWVAIRVLGAGGYGIAGHWRYEAEGAHKMGYVQGEIHDIVVKQASAVTSKGLINEAFIMEMLTKTGSRHFPQIYGRIHRDVGQQDRVSVDQKRREVHRIFMEFCAGGSLAAYINDSSYHGNLTPETDLWSWFHCFAKAIVVLERGHEQDSESRFSRREPWGHEREVVHFDIKPDNALITVRDNDEHIGAKRVVISDFGISEVLPNERNGPHRDHDVILKEYEEVGTVIFRAPEQQGKLPRARRRYAACTNIFQIGCIMYCLMQTNIFPDYDPPTWTTLTGRNKMHRTMGGQDLELETRLSRTLRGLAAECLHLDPRYRPTAVELLRRTRDGLKRINPWGATASKIYEKLKPVDTLMLDRWFGQNPSVVWPQRIPEMEEVVNLRRRQAHQVDLAKKYTPQNPPTANNQGG
ncbi:NEK protein kinase [Pseudogymnoascus destructans 20631-21]|uniref:non-specific serine/threonine protein kinase n=2 Tax=Pseudogymnoascus destructans TaxID=655981 RepID=L8FRW5_PSED2|nr:NEK protein kinase [Pseudogymnoascus destructans 20631-21]